MPKAPQRSARVLSVEEGHPLIGGGAFVRLEGEAVRYWVPDLLTKQIIQEVGALEGLRGRMVTWTCYANARGSSTTVRSIRIDSEPLAL